VPEAESQTMLITFLDIGRVIVPIVVLLAMLGIGNAFGISLEKTDYTLSWHAYLSFVYWMGLPIFPGGSFLIMKSLFECARAAASRQWPVTRGKILSSEVTWTLAGRGGIMYGAKVSYRYSAAGRYFENNAIQAAPANFYDREIAKDIAARYPVGADIDVHYDPEDPSESVLDSSDDNSRRNLGIGLLCVCVPFVMAAAFVWSNSRY